MYKGLADGNEGTGVQCLPDFPTRISSTPSTVGTCVLLELPLYTYRSTPPVSLTRSICLKVMASSQRPKDRHSPTPRW